MQIISRIFGQFSVEFRTRLAAQKWLWSTNMQSYAKILSLNLILHILIVTYLLKPPCPGVASRSKRGSKFWGHISNKCEKNRENFGILEHFKECPTYVKIVLKCLKCPKTYLRRV